MTESGVYLNTFFEQTMKYVTKLFLSYVLSARSIDFVSEK